MMADNTQVLAPPKPKADRAMMKEALLLFATRDHLVELRVKHADGSVETGCFDADHLELLMDEATRVNEQGALVWVTLNPVDKSVLETGRAVNSGLRGGKATRADEIVRRAWLLVDIDAQRTKEGGSTAAQLESAKECSQRAYGFLKGLGWARPIVAMSGNGFHMLYSINLPNDDKTRQLMRGGLEELGRRFSTREAKVDTSVHDAGRVLKLYGTVSTKGTHTPEAPWRLSGVVNRPPTVDVVTREQLEALVALAPPKPKPAPATEHVSRQSIHAEGAQRQAGPATVDEAREALFACDPDLSYPDWRNALVGAKMAGLSVDDGVEWSRRGAKFKSDEDVRAKWRGIKPEGGITSRTLFDYAYKNGWQGPSSKRIQRTSAPSLAPGEVDELLANEAAKRQAKAGQRTAALQMAPAQGSATARSSMEVEAAVDPYAGAGFGAEATGASSAPVSQEWPEPRVLKADIPPAPQFEAAALLPPVLADFVLDEADRMPCPPDFIAATLIVSLGAVVGASCALKPKRRDDWIITPNLFGGVVGDPSAKKTPATSLPMKFLGGLESDEAKRLEEEMKAYQAELAVFEARRSAAKKAMAGAANTGNDAKIEQAAEGLRDLEEPVAPAHRRFKTNDGTVAKLGELLAVNPAGMLVFRDELTGLLDSWDKVGNEGDRAFFLEAWNGTGSFSVDRIGRGSIHVPNLCLSVFGGIQPDLMGRYLAGVTAGLDNDGRVQRFQVMVYPEQVEWAWRDRYPVDGVREAVRDAYKRLASLDPVAMGASEASEFVKLPHFSFDGEAQEIFIEWSTELHTKRLPAEQSLLMRQHLAKFEKLFGAIALILHLVGGQPGFVKKDSALRAAAWCEYLEGHARRIYALAEVPKTAVAELLGRRIIDRKLKDGFTARDVSRKGWAGLSTPAQAEGALAQLEEHGWVMAADTDSPTGRPTTRYYVNPKLLRRRS